jgi:phage regulator Rha-like protein
MSAVTLTGAMPLTMTSLEIAELVEVRHDNVKRTIETLGEKGVITLPQIEEVSNPGPGPKFVGVYRLGKRDSHVVVAQLSPQFTARLVDRWQELESGVALVPQTLPEALRLAADLAEQKAQAEAALALAAPKAAALDRMAQETEGAVCLRIAAKLAQVPERKFIALLHEEGWIFRHHHSLTWQGHSEKERAGYLELKRTRVTRDDGSDKTVEQVLITPRGLAKATELIERKAPWLRKVDTLPPTKLRESNLHRGALA